MIEQKERKKWKEIEKKKNQSENVSTTTTVEGYFGGTLNLICVYIKDPSEKCKEGPEMVFKK
jgi:hypothetical protein